MLVEVEEAPATSASYGVGVEMGQLASTGENGAVVDRVYAAPRGFFEMTRRNLWGKNRSLTLLTSVSLRPTEPGVNVNTTAAEWQYGFNQFRVVGTFREPRAFNTPGDAQLSAFVERGVRSSFNFNRRGVRAEYARRFPNRLVALGRYAYDYTELFDTKISIADQPLVDRLFPQVRLSSLFGSLIRDTRNDIIDPERGSVVGGELDVALRVLGSEVGFAKGFAQAFVYRQAAGPPAVGRRRRRPAWHRPCHRRREPADRSVRAGPRWATRRGHQQPAAGQRALLRRRRHHRARVRPRSPRHRSHPQRLRLPDRRQRRDRRQSRAPHARTSRASAWSASWTPATSSCMPAISTSAKSAARPGFGIRYRSPLGPLRVDVGFKLDRQEVDPGRRAPGRLPPVDRPGLLGCSKRPGASG